MEKFRTWLLGITAAAMVLALVDSLMPEGAVKRVGKLAGGLVLILVIIQPVLGLDYQTLAAALMNYRFETEEYSNALELENERLQKIIIEDRTGAYIQDRAVGLDIDCTVTVRCHAGDDGVFYPHSVLVQGDLTEDQIHTMTKVIEGEVAIPPENQQYERTSGA